MSINTIVKSISDAVFDLGLSARKAMVLYDTYFNLSEIYEDVREILSMKNATSDELDSIIEVFEEDSVKRVFKDLIENRGPQSSEYEREEFERLKTDMVNTLLIVSACRPELVDMYASYISLNGLVNKTRNSITHLDTVKSVIDNSPNSLSKVLELFQNYSNLTTLNTHWRLSEIVGNVAEKNPQNLDLVIDYFNRVKKNAEEDERSYPKTEYVSLKDVARRTVETTHTLFNFRGGMSSNSVDDLLMSVISFFDLGLSCNFNRHSLGDDGPKLERVIENLEEFYARSPVVFSKFMRAVYVLSYSMDQSKFVSEHCDTLDYLNKNAKEYVKPFMGMILGGKSSFLEYDLFGQDFRGITFQNSDLADAIIEYGEGREISVFSAIVGNQSRVIIDKDLKNKFFIPMLKAKDPDANYKIRFLNSVADDGSVWYIINRYNKEEKLGFFEEKLNQYVERNLEKDKQNRY